MEASDVNCPYDWPKMSDVNAIGYFTGSHDHNGQYNCYDFVLTDCVKQNRPGKVFGNLRLYKYIEPELCVYATLDH